jgi:hypothetical protein
MDPSLENPMLRFKAFWLTLGLMLLFAIVGVIYRARHVPKAGISEMRLAALKTQQNLTDVQVETLREWFKNTRGEDAANAEAEIKRIATLTEVRAAQSKSISDWGLSYTDPQGGHLPTIRVPDTLIAKAVDTLKANPGHKTEQIVLGSKTFLEQQSKKHDPTESEFLKK